MQKPEKSQWQLEYQRSGTPITISSQREIHLPVAVLAASQLLPGSHYAQRYPVRQSKSFQNTELALRLCAQ